MQSPIFVCLFQVAQIVVLGRGTFYKILESPRAPFGFSFQKLIGFCFRKRKGQKDKKGSQSQWAEPILSLKPRSRAPSSQPTEPFSSRSRTVASGPSPLPNCHTRANPRSPPSRSPRAVDRRAPPVRASSSSRTRDGHLCPCHRRRPVDLRAPAPLSTPAPGYINPTSTYALFPPCKP